MIELNNSSNVALAIRNGDLDINVQDLFLSIMIKGLIYSLNDAVKVRGESVPHLILHTGDDRMYLDERGFNFSKEPAEPSNETNTIYMSTPRCVVNPAGIDLDTAQLTSPYSLGSVQYASTDKNYEGMYTFKGEFRRVPIKMSFDLKYYTDSFTDMLEIMQYVISNLAFIRTYDIMYMGQKIKCSYKIPDSFSEEHTMNIDGTYSDNRDHTMSLSIEVETNIPVFNNKTIMPADKFIMTPVVNMYPIHKLNTDE